MKTGSALRACAPYWKNSACPRTRRSPACRAARASALARALVDEPDLLLLDEPTNHLDFDGIAWLEDMLRNWKGAAVIITHDRRFLDAVATRIVELDRGRLLSFPGNFSQWQERKAQWLESERLEQARFDKLLAQEEVWIRKGVEARRTRNEGRVRRLERLRVERAERRERVGNVSLALAEGQRSGKLVAELEHVGKRFGDKTVVDDYSTTILRGDRIGIIGPNGAGKTTLLKLILGEMTPDSGNTRMGTNVEVAYFDQMRAQLDENATLVDIISPGSEWVEIGGTRKHVMSYLGDFLFSPARAGSPVRSLSGGERARLLLARLFARPANVLVLDEPTNDLDIETLELLEELLQEYSGTVLLVSHDRAFLNNVVTQTIASEGDGRWRDYVGGYDEWLVQRPAPAAPAADTDKASKPALDEAAARKAAKPKPARAAKMNSWELRELEGLPDAIAALEAQQAELAGKLADGSLYRDAPAEVERINGEQPNWRANWKRNSPAGSCWKRGEKARSDHRAVHEKALLIYISRAFTRIISAGHPCPTLRPERARPMPRRRPAAPRKYCRKALRPAPDRFRGPASACRYCAAARRNPGHGSWRSLPACPARPPRRRQSRRVPSHAGRCSTSATAGMLLQAARMRRAVRAQEEARTAAGGGRDQGLAMRLALEDGQTVPMRPHATLEDRVAVVQQMLRRDGGGDRPFGVAHVLGAFLGRDVFEHDLQGGKARRNGFITRSTNTASRSNTSMAGSVTSPCTSKGMPHFSSASSAFAHCPADR